MKKIGLYLIMAGCALMAKAQTEVSRYVPGVTVEGVTYCLPRTALRFVVTAQKEVFAPGELNKYADRYLRISDARTEAETKWTIKDVQVEAYGQPDTTKYYSIAFRSKTIAPFVTLARDGRILAIRDEGQDIELPAVPQREAATAAPDPNRFFTQEMLTVGSRAKLAELVAQEIFETRDGARSLVRGESESTPKDGKQLEMMLASLTEREEALTSLFTGTTQTSTEVFTFTYVPEKPVDGEMICRFSSYLGLVDNENLAGAPIYLTVRALESMPKTENNAAADKKRAKLEEEGVVYNVPVMTEVKVYDTKRTYVKKEMPMAQFGRVEILSDVLFNKKATTRVLFDGATGAIKQLAEQ
ncbi:MAG: DUF4831 family protein [Bacteroidaceae bacterium]|nr:DUF4831 family protein [Bacteroidaceae bacterium]